MNDSWVIVDTETDGLFEPIHVVEIAAQRMMGWEPDGAPFQIFLDHGVDIPPDAVAIHGYTKKFLRKHGKDPRKAHERFRDYVCNLPLVAHNLSYDWNRALCPEWERLGVEPIGQRGFCTMTLSRRTIDETSNYKLDTIRTHFKLKTGKSHHAANDVDAVVQLFRKVLGPRLDPLNFESIDDLIKFSRKTPVAKCLGEVQAGFRAPAKTAKKKATDAWYVLTADEQTHGPHKAAEIHELAQGQPCYVWQEGMEDWVVSTEQPIFMNFATKRKKKKSQKSKRKAVSKSMAELIGLCKGIMADNEVSAEEIICLSNWLQEAGCINEWPASEIAEAIERILADGVITPEEQDEMAKLLRGLESSSSESPGGEHKKEKTNPKFVCTHCGQKLEAPADMIGLSIDCPVCNQKIQVPDQKQKEKTSELVCPYCQAELKRRKVPQRRSSFKCHSCSKKIYVEPDQPIYPSPFLTEVEAGYVGYLWQLDHWVFTMGSNEDYFRKKKELSKRFECEPGIGDVLWGLMNESMIKTCEDEADRKMVKTLMNDFKTFEKDAKVK